MEKYIKLGQKYAEWRGKKFGIAVNTGTGALHLSLVALGIKEGDEVIVPDFAFAAVAFAVTYCNATPIFVDVDEDYNIDPKKVKEAITEKTKAIIVVHTYGRKAKVEKIQAITDIPIVEDVCEAQGISLCPGTIAVYSLYKNKILPAEEGGIILTDDENIYNMITSLKNISNDGKYFHNALGFNYRMTNSQAKLGLKSFNDREQIFAQRNKILKKYQNNFKSKNVDTPWVFDMLTENPNNVLDNIPESRPFFKPQSSFPIYNQVPKERTLHISKRGFVINLSPENDHDKIIDKLKNLV